MPRRLYRFVVDAIRKPRDELSRQEQRVRFAIDLGAHCWRTLQYHRAEGMAAELSYRTIFSMIPVCVLGLVMFRAFGGLEQVQERLEQQLFSFFGVPDVAYVEPADPGAPPPPPAAELEGAPEPLGDARAADDAPPGLRDDERDRQDEGAEEDDITTDELERAQEQRVRASIRRALSQLVAQVAELDFASIGVVGVLLLIYAAIALLDSLEHIFNLIFESPASRPWHLRIAIHWSIITLGSVLLALSLYLSGQLVTWAVGLGMPGTRALNRLLAFLASWVLLFLLYALMPNTKVAMRAAALGALVAAVLWEFAKIAFQIYVTTALPYSALYGTLGLIPVFLFWVYITWLIILFGLVWAYTLQVAPGRVPTREEDEQHAVEHDEVDFDTVLPVVVIVAHAFADGQVVDRSTIARALGLPPRVVRRLCHQLEEAALIRSLEPADQEDGAVTLARPADRIRVTEIVELVDTIPAGTPAPVRAFLEQLREARCRAADGMTLADLVDREEAAGSLEAALKKVDVEAIREGNGGA